MIGVITKYVPKIIGLAKAHIWLRYPFHKWNGNELKIIL